MRLVGTAAGGDRPARVRGPARAMGRSGSPLLFNWKSVSILYFLYLNYAKHLYVRKHIAMSCSTQKGFYLIYLRVFN
jgi:hypothetical protein